MSTQVREYQKVIDHIYHLIENGSLVIGDRLPNERSLSELLFISRNSTREALRIMENLGLTESRRGSGNYLVGDMTHSISGAIDMMLLLKQTNRNEICDFRRNMEKSVCRSIIDNNNLDKWYPKLSQILAELGESDSNAFKVELDRRFHYTLIDATENSFWIILLESVSEVYRRWIDTAFNMMEPQTAEELFQTHKNMLRALLDRDYISCENAIDQHYDIVDRVLSSRA